MINQFPAGKLWDEYDKAMSQINELTERAEAAEARADALQGELTAANEDAAALAGELELEQNPGFTCKALREHRARVGGGE